MSVGIGRAVASHVQVVTRHGWRRSPSSGVGRSAISVSSGHRQSRTMSSFTLLLLLAFPLLLLLLLLLPPSPSGARTHLLSSRLDAPTMAFFSLLLPTRLHALMMAFFPLLSRLHPSPFHLFPQALGLFPHVLGSVYTGKLAAISSSTPEGIPITRNLFINIIFESL